MTIEHYKNFSLENITEEIDGVLYTEEWRPIRGYEGEYEISSFGRVKSLVCPKGIRIKKSFASYRYRRIPIGPFKAQVKLQVHRLVADAFIQNPDNLPEVNHKKGIRWDNRVWELEWNTSSQNKKHAFEVLGRKANTPWLGKFGLDCPKSHSVKKVSSDGSIVHVFASKREAAKEFMVSAATIANYINKKKILNGFLLKLSND